jgi:ribosome-associated toxin RatA of RatAB toxin-antitoxin module
MRRTSLAPALAFAAALFVSSFAAVSTGDDLPPKGTVDIKSFEVPGSSSPKIVARAVVEAPAKKIWAIVSDCAHYKGRMPRVAAAELLKKEGNVHTCKVTIEMPFPLSNLTAVTAATHTETDTVMKREWKLVSGDYKVNQGSWEVKALPDGTSYVVYTVHAEPNSAVPAAIREAAQKKALPEMFEKVKAEANKLP